MSEYMPIKLAFYDVEPYDLDHTLNPIIFLHGLFDNKEVWHDIPQIICNETKRKGFAIDFRNTGDSEYTDDASYDVNIEDLRYFMDSNGISKTILVGHSMGGITAGRFALLEPERVEAVVIEDMHLGPCDLKWKQFALKQAYLWSDAVRRIPPFLNKSEGIRFAVDYMYNQIPSDTQEVFSRKECLYKCNFNLKQHDDGSYEVKINLPPIIEFTENEEGLSLVPDAIYDGPAFIIYGTLSPFKIYEYEEKVRKHLPNVKFFSIENATHNVHVDQPEKFAETLLKCLLTENNE